VTDSSATSTSLNARTIPRMSMLTACVSIEREIADFFAATSLFPTVLVVITKLTV